MSEFKAGDIVTREGYFDRKILFIGEEKYFYSIVDPKNELNHGVESCCSIKFLNKWTLQND